MTQHIWSYFVRLNDTSYFGSSYLVTMKSRYVWIILAMGLFLGCRTQDGSLFRSVDGNYRGTFTRASQTSEVDLVLDNGRFSGSADSVARIGSGSYDINSGEIEFVDENFWTADFDWSLILNGTWEFEKNGRELVLTHERGDVYRLIKK